MGLSLNIETQSYLFARNDLFLNIFQYLCSRKSTPFDGTPYNMVISK